VLKRLKSGENTDKNPTWMMYSYHPRCFFCNYLRTIKKLYTTAAKAPNVKRIGRTTFTLRPLVSSLLVTVWQKMALLPDSQPLPTDPIALEFYLYNFLNFIFI